MSLDVVFVGMSDPEHVILRWVQPHEGQTLEVVHDLGLLFLARRIGGGKADHASAVGPLVAAGVNERFGAVRITAKDLGQGLAGHGHGLSVRIADQVAVVVVGEHLVPHKVADRTHACAFAVAEELDQHRRAASRSVQAGVRWSASGG